MIYLPTIMMAWFLVGASTIELGVQTENRHSWSSRPLFGNTNYMLNGTILPSLRGATESSSYVAYAAYNPQFSLNAPADQNLLLMHQADGFFRFTRKVDWENTVHFALGDLDPSGLQRVFNDARSLPGDGTLLSWPYTRVIGESRLTIPQGRFILWNVFARYELQGSIFADRRTSPFVRTQVKPTAGVSVTGKVNSHHQISAHLEMLASAFDDDTDLFGITPLIGWSSNLDRSTTTYARAGWFMARVTPELHVNSIAVGLPHVVAGIAWKKKWLGMGWRVNLEGGIRPQSEITGDMLEENAFVALQGTVRVNKTITVLAGLSMSHLLASIRNPALFVETISTQGINADAEIWWRPIDGLMFTTGLLTNTGVLGDRFGNPTEARVNLTATIGMRFTIPIYRKGTPQWMMRNMDSITRGTEGREFESSMLQRPGQVEENYTPSNIDDIMEMANPIPGQESALPYQESGRLKSLEPTEALQPELDPEHSETQEDQGEPQ